MTRTFARLALAALLVAGAGFARAQEEAPALLVDPNQAEPAPTPAAQAAPVAGCPDGNCHPGMAHGAHAANTRYYEQARANAGYYPNGVDNYSDQVSAHAYAGHGGCRTCANGQCQYRYYGHPDLFYNYYAWPSCTGWGAQLYVSPLPVPPHVGHTYITYQPLMPHEFMYHHHRTYHRYYNGGQGLTRTSVRYSASLFGK
jgi:hypothetical protein